ncbi:MAG TPA: hypothetical protein VME70_13350 [Mycobacteriales bacterium]|nr:hypothetical protein [Mycobacteriales bacterium]
MTGEAVGWLRAHRRAATVAGLVVALLYSWVAGHFSTFTTSAAVATFVPGAIGVGVAFGSRRSVAVRPRVGRRAWLAWALVLAGFTALELAALFLGADHAHPTVSDLVNPWFGPVPARAALFAAWLGFGYWLSRR